MLPFAGEPSVRKLVIASQVRVGFIGLGIMGLPMAANLLRSGFPVTVWNRSRPGIEAALASGATEAASPRAVARSSDVLITIVTDSPDVEAVLFGPDGAADGFRPGAVFIDMSTISPAVTRDLAGRLAQRGVAMLDAPVSGGEGGARSSTLAIMVGGEREVVERARPLFEALGKTIVHVGPVGAGQTVKLCNQVAGAIHLLAMSECLVLAQKAGVDLAKMLEAVSSGAAASWMLSNLAPRVLDRDFAPGFMIRLQQKDLRLALAAAQELELALPGTALVHQLFHALEADGAQDEGTQALVRTIEAMAGVEVRRGG